MNSFCAGAISGIIEVTCTHPIDYMKTMKQQNHSLRYIISNTSFSQYYSGYFPRVIGIVPVRFTFWGTQTYIQSILEKHHIESKYNFMLIGTGAACMQSIIDTPVEVAKIALITEKGNLTRKIPNIMKGFGPTLFRNILFSNSVSYCCSHMKGKYNNNKKIETFVSAGLGGLIGSIISQPLDYVKTKKQLPISDKRTSIQILREESWSTLFTGGSYRALLGMSTMGIGYFTYMFLKF